MKTIADYQPDPLIIKSVGLLAGLLRHREPDSEALWLVECQVEYDMRRQGICVTEGEVRVWAARAIAEGFDEYEALEARFAAA